MMHERDADRLRDALEPLLPAGLEVTSVPWSHDGPKAEWIVTVWEDDDVLFDVFNVGRGFVCRKVGRGPEVGTKAYDPAGIIRNVEAARRVPTAHLANTRGRPVCGVKGTAAIAPETAGVTCERCRRTDTFDARQTAEAFTQRQVTS